MRQTASVHTRIGAGVLQIDTLLGGGSGSPPATWSRGRRRCWSRPAASRRCRRCSPRSTSWASAPDDLAGVAVTHIHLDHAGGVGDVARAFPNATVYVHEKGARHLADPTGSCSSAAMVYGDLLDSLYGRLDPTPAERIHVLEDGEEIVVGPGRTLTTVDSPGHAKHHLALHDSQSGHPVRRATRSACGCPTPACCARRRRRPTSTSTRRSTSLRKFADRSPTGVALAHYGLVPDPIDDPARRPRASCAQWAEVAEAAWRDGRGHRRGARRGVRRPSSTGIDPAQREKLETLNGVHSNAAGFRRWLEQRQKPRARPLPLSSGTLRAELVVVADQAVGELEDLGAGGEVGACARPRSRRRSSILRSGFSRARRRVPLSSSKAFCTVSSRGPSVSTSLVYFVHCVRKAPTSRSTSSDVCSTMTASNAWRMTPSIANRVSGEQKTIFSREGVVDDRGVGLVDEPGDRLVGTKSSS